MGLTRKQRVLVDYLSRFIQEQGFSPTYGEIAEHFGYRSRATVYEHIRNLVGKGVLAIDPERPRSIEILRTDDRAQPYPEVRPPLQWVMEECNDYPIPPVPPTSAVSASDIRAYRDRWHALRAQMRPGDTLWTFRAPETEWLQSAGRAGYALVRQGEVVSGVVTHDQLARAK